MSNKWYGRVTYDNEGIVREREFETQAEAEAYKRGAEDMKEQCADDELEDYHAAASNLESFEE